MENIDLWYTIGNPEKNDTAWPGTHRGEGWYWGLKGNSTRKTKNIHTHTHTTLLYSCANESDIGGAKIIQKKQAHTHTDARVYQTHIVRYAKPHTHGFAQG